jgi:hypothetical protein
MLNKFMAPLSTSAFTHVNVVSIVTLVLGISTDSFARKKKAADESAPIRPAL